MSARLILALRRLAARISRLADSQHLDTDPACTNYRPTRPGSRLDRASRGHSCETCMRAQHIAWVNRAVTREWGDHTTPPKIGPKGPAGDSGAARR